MCAMLRVVVVVLVACAQCACGSAAAGADPLVSALAAGGAARAALCVDATGCAGALWARHWLLARASCIARARTVHRALVLLHHGPEDCHHFFNVARHPSALEALVRFVHPAYAPAPEHAPARWDPLDAALVLLATPAPAPPVHNHSAIYALIPELSSWVRYVPATVPWSLEPAPTPTPTPAALDPAQYRALDSPLRLLAATVLLPVAALLAGFLLLLRVPERAHSDDQEQKLLVVADAPLDDTV